MDKTALYKLGYGLYVLTAREGDKDNGCIINTAIQVASDPLRIAISVINANYTCDMIKRTGQFNISCLTQSAPFGTFSHFGFSSGRDTDKFADWSGAQRAENGILYVTDNTNGYLSCRVLSSTDLGSHTLFVAELTDAAVLSDEISVTYAYYQSDIKPKPRPKTQKKVVYICKVCGYVYEGDQLPEDFICPLCHHTTDDFERVELDG